MTHPAKVVGYWAVCSICIINKAILDKFTEDWICPRCAEFTDCGTGGAFGDVDVAGAEHIHIHPLPPALLRAIYNDHDDEEPDLGNIRG